MAGANLIRLARWAAALTVVLGVCACDASRRPAPVTQGGPSAAYAAPGNTAPPGPVAPVGAAGRAHPDQVVVQPGQTLYEISRRYDVPIRALIDGNQLEPPYRLQAGRALVLPQVRTHLVRAGDTLYGVSRLYGVDATTLAQANHLTPPYVVRTGTVLVLPPQAAPGAAIADSATPAPAPAATSASGITASPLPPPAGTAASTGPQSAPSQSPAPAAPVAAAPPPSAQPDQTAALPPPPPRGGRNFLWPVRGKVIAHYGSNSNGTHNDGVNIAAAEGTPIVAADAGVVAYAGNELRGYGNLILIKHADGWMTAYAHGSKILVTRGERVQRGQVVGRVGATGAVSEPQLHFEVRKGTRALDPLDYMSGATASATSG